MAALEDEILKHQFIYVPWVQDKPVYQNTPALALYLRDKHRARLTVVCSTKSNVPDELTKTPSVTERSGSIMDGGIVFAYCPTYKAMSKTTRLEKSVIVVVEWPTESYEGWAKLVGAYNVITSAVMSTNLTEAGRKELEGIVFEGYKGWHDQIAERMTIGHLERLAELGQYDRDVVLAYVRQEKSEDSVKSFIRILDRFEKTHRPAPGSSSAPIER
ncbi:hypothetical protein SAMN04488693_1293 [Arthrobacter subterraneus]|uniref:Uncharacterized protein n=1 Tax=Arthrobacter subterraneus TaxID=335973 RepID=A0A1G8P3J6_9MICC|nr:hypothetical protein [Arthrobacter subterraneus]SDI87063.1 hypothetical protein SAMN04488693_1293 [Arthrobacter subterraneus]